MKSQLRSSILTFVRLYGASRARTATRKKIQGSTPRILLVPTRPSRRSYSGHADLTGHQDPHTKCSGYDDGWSMVK